MRLRPPRLDRIVRGRAWIPVLGVLLVAIVGLRVEVLKLGSGVGAQVQQATLLESSNAVLRSQISALSDSSRIIKLAESYGMHMPDPLDVHLVSAAAGTHVGAAERNIAPPSRTTFLSGLVAEQQTDSQASANAAAQSAAAGGATSTSSTAATGLSSGTNLTSSTTSTSGGTSGTIGRRYGRRYDRRHDRHRQLDRIIGHQWSHELGDDVGDHRRDEHGSSTLNGSASTTGDAGNSTAAGSGSVGTRRSRHDRDRRQLPDHGLDHRLHHRRQRTRRLARCRPALPAAPSTRSTVASD